MLRNFWLGSFLAVLLLTAGAVRAQDFENARVEMTDLGHGLYMMTGVGGNMVLSVGEDGVFLVDDQYAPMSDKIRAAIATVTDQPVRFLINTHWHGDHTGGNENFGETGAIIFAHDNVRKRMSTEQVNKIFNRTTPPSPEGALPVITFSKDVTLHFNGLTIHATHAPRAHTDGDSIIIFEGANVIHAGDTYFHKMYPFIDASSGGTIEGVLDAQQTMLDLSDDETKIVPGHGPLSDKADLQATRDMLERIHTLVRPMHDDEMDIEAIIGAEPLKGIDTGMEGGFLNQEQFLRVLKSSFSDRD